MGEIVFRNVTKRYGNITAVDDASFIVNDNEFFCFFGPPLCGKSTILRLILGLETPDAGEIQIDGKPVRGVSPADRNVAMVFQNLALFPHMSAADNVRFPLVERGVPEAQIEKRLTDVAAKLHIGHILHKPPAQLSGGERQRVAIARAIIRDPVAYLMDDPISALDARLREETRVELKRIQRELGKTLVYVTHDQEEAMSVADRMAILENGKIRQIGSPVEIYDHPVNVYVARLLGSPMINIMKSAACGCEHRSGRRCHWLAGVAAPTEASEIGLRPEDIKVRPWSDDRPGQPAKVIEVEPLGGYTVVTLDAGELRLRALDARPAGYQARCNCRRSHASQAEYIILQRAEVPSHDERHRKKDDGEESMAKSTEFEPDVKVRTKEYKIGCVGAGMIMAECHLAAYKEAGFPVAAIASRTMANAEKVAKRWKIPTIHATPEALIEDKSVEIIDIAFPPDQQPALIRHALKQKHIKAILAQKPLALSLAEAIKLRNEAHQAGKSSPSTRTCVTTSRCVFSSRSSIPERLAISSLRRSTCMRSRIGSRSLRTMTA